MSAVGSGRRSSARAGCRRRTGSRSSTRRSWRPGFRAAGADCGLKGGGETDVGLLVCDADQVALGAAADPQRLRRGAGPGLPRAMRRRAIRAAVVNSGNANAETGEQGYRDALAMCDAAAPRLGLRPRAGRRRRDRRDRRAAADRRRASAGSRGGRRRSPPTAATPSPRRS